MKKRGLDSGRWLKRHPPCFSAPELGENWQKKVREAVEIYPNLRRERQKQMETFSQRGRGRPVERLVDCCLPKKEQKKYEAVFGAIQDCKHIHHGSTAIQLVKARFWAGGELPMEQVAGIMGLPLGRAKRLERMFFGRVARRMGHRARRDKDGVVR